MTQIWDRFVSRRIGPQTHGLCGTYMEVAKQSITKIFCGYDQLTTNSLSHIRSPCAQAIHCEDIICMVVS
jgi:hypothetical protein